jgi:hypothetical protein
MILDCQYCYTRIIIKPADDEPVVINFCPHCGEPTEEGLKELDFNE